MCCGSCRPASWNAVYGSHPPGDNRPGLAQASNVIIDDPYGEVFLQTWLKFPAMCNLYQRACAVLLHFSPSFFSFFSDVNGSNSPRSALLQGGRLHRLLHAPSHAVSLHLTLACALVWTHGHAHAFAGSKPIAQLIFFLATLQRGAGEEDKGLGGQKTGHPGDEGKSQNEGSKKKALHSEPAHGNLLTAAIFPT